MCVFRRRDSRRSQGLRRTPAHQEFVAQPEEWLAVVDPYAKSQSSSGQLGMPVLYHYKSIDEFQLVGKIILSDRMILRFSASALDVLGIEI
jgi:hypothetical protein